VPGYDGGVSRLSSPRRRLPSGALPWLVPLLALALAGCPDVEQAAPPTQCTKAYEKCTLREGVLGICDTTACAPGQSEPCLVCRSQH